MPPNAHRVRSAINTRTYALLISPLFISYRSSAAVEEAETKQRDWSGPGRVLVGPSGRDTAGPNTRVCPTWFLLSPNREKCIREKQKMLKEEKGREGENRAGTQKRGEIRVVPFSLWWGRELTMRGEQVSFSSRAARVAVAAARSPSCRALRAARLKARPPCRSPLAVAARKLLSLSSRNDRARPLCLAGPQRWFSGSPPGGGTGRLVSAAVLAGFCCCCHSALARAGRGARLAAALWTASPNHAVHLT